jgi:hypothetical protein
MFPGSLPFIGGEPFLFLLVIFYKLSNFMSASLRAKIIGARLFIYRFVSNSQENCQIQ